MFSEENYPRSKILSFKMYDSTLVRISLNWYFTSHWCQRSEQQFPPYFLKLIWYFCFSWSRGTILAETYSLYLDNWWYLKNSPNETKSLYENFLKNSNTLNETRQNDYKINKLSCKKLYYSNLLLNYRYDKKKTEHNEGNHWQSKIYASKPNERNIFLVFRDILETSDITRRLNNFFSNCCWNLVDKKFHSTAGFIEEIDQIEKITPEYPSRTYELKRGLFFVKVE